MDGLVGGLMDYFINGGGVGDVRHMLKDHSDSKRKPTAATLATLSD